MDFSSPSPSTVSMRRPTEPPPEKNRAGLQRILTSFADLLATGTLSVENLLRGFAGLVRKIVDYELFRNAARRYTAATVVDRRPESNCLVMSNAGGVDSLIVRNGSAEALRVEGMPLGLFASAAFEQIELKAAPGDILALASDGILDCEDRAVASTVLSVRRKPFRLIEMRQRTLSRKESWRVCTNTRRATRRKMIRLWLY